MARGAESWCVQITALPQAGVHCRASEMGARERCGRWIDGQRRGELAVLGELGWEVDERWLRARSGEERSVPGDDVAWAGGRWSVGGGGGLGGRGRRRDGRRIRVLCGYHCLDGLCEIWILFDGDARVRVY
jgi:hypothetical protein